MPIAKFPVRHKFGIVSLSKAQQILAESYAAKLRDVPRYVLLCFMHVTPSDPHPPPPGDSRAFDHFIFVFNIKFSRHGQFPTIARGWGVGGEGGSDIDRCITLVTGHIPIPN